MNVQKIFVVGTGQMGSGIVQTAAISGFHVKMQDLSEDVAEKAHSRIVKNMEKLVAKEKITEQEKKDALDRIELATSLDAVADTDLIIEAVLENIDLKGKIFQQIDEIAKHDTIITSNTSSISITKIAAYTKRPESVAGMHFFNPVPSMKLLEVIKGYSTSQETLDTISAVGARLGKVTVISDDKPGFIVSRALDLFLNEAICLLDEGVGTAEDIDNGLIYGCNHPMGPLALTDMIGLDVLLAVMEFLHKEFGDSKYRPSPLLRKMVSAGKLGRKTGEGFYKYD
jgi:3-hydroxybutyryl-CoA dehydrogenase